MAKTEKGIYATGVRDLTRSIQRMEKTLRDEVRTAGLDLAADAMKDIRRAASTTQERAAMSAFKAYRDRIPKFGYPARAQTGVSGGARASELFPGVEYGGRRSWRTMQFRPHRGRAGYFFWETFRDRGAGWASDWFHLIAEALEDDWNSGAKRAAGRR